MLDSLDTLIAFVVIMLVVSLLITIAVQAGAALFNLRGINLAEGLKRTFAVIVPETADRRSETNAKSLTNFILKGQFLSDSFLPDWPVFRWWRHATAIRPAEVFDAVQRIAIGKEPVGDKSELQSIARNVLVALGLDDATIDSAAAQIKSAEKSTAKLRDETLKMLPDDQRAGVQASLESITSELNSARQAAGMQVMNAEQKLDAARKKFTSLSSSCQERAQQWLTMHTRILTVIFAFLAASGLQLDTVDIFKLVSTNRLVREKLVAETTAVTSQAEKILGAKQGVLQQGLDDWRKALPDDQKQAVASVQAAPDDSRGQLRDRVAMALHTSNVAGAPDLLNRLDKSIDAAAQTNLEVNAKAYKSVKPDLDNTGFDLFVTDTGRRWHHGWWNDFSPHALGMLFSAALLSLGAPFWYNILKNLTSLRSAVAQSMAEEKAAPAKPAAA